MLEHVLAVDPGHTHSAFVLYDTIDGRLLAHGKEENGWLLSHIKDAWGPREIPVNVFVIEQVACMGMAVGAEVFETVFWSGRFWERADRWNLDLHRVKRHEVKTHLCGNQRAKDPNIRQALIDRYGPGKDVAIGTKKNPGPLYGVTKDVWSALAVAVTFAARLTEVSR